jgi:phosphopantothenoylcysteine synthetase/decarboxylase
MSQVLYLVACGGRPAEDLPDFVATARDLGWDTCVVATPAALKFMDCDKMASISGRPVRYDYKQPDEPDAFPPPGAIIVAPATFNTINKWAYGASDTLALGLLNEGIGLGIPIIAVPFPSTALARHPAFEDSVRRLRSWGVEVLFDPDTYPLPTPNLGPASRNLFPWQVLAGMLSRLTASRQSGTADG